MQKQDIKNPLNRGDVGKEPAPAQVIKEADSSVLKTRKILKMNPFTSKKGDDTKPTKAVFNFSSKTPGNQTKGISGEITLKPTTSSLDFFRGSIKTAPPLENKKPVSGQITLTANPGSLDFFTGNKVTAKNTEESKKAEAEQKEAKPEEPKKVDEAKEKETEKKEDTEQKKSLFGDYVNANNLGSGLFSGLVTKKTVQSTPVANQQNQGSGLFGKGSSNGASLFGSSNTESSLFGKKMPTSGLFAPKQTPVEKKPSDSSQVEQIDQKNFNDPNSKPLFDKPVIGGLFQTLKSANSGGLFSGLATSGNKEGGLFSGNLFSKAREGDSSNFFKKNNLDEVEEDEDGEDDLQKKEDSTDPAKVEMKVTYKSEFDTVINLNVRDFKEQAVGGPAPDGGFGIGSVSLETKKPEEGAGPTEKHNLVTFAFRNPAKLVKHQSNLIRGISTYKTLKSRKECVVMQTFKNKAEGSQLVKFIVKVLFNEDQDSQKFVEKLDLLMK